MTKQEARERLVGFYFNGKEWVASRGSEVLATFPNTRKGKADCIAFTVPFNAALAVEI